METIHSVGYHPPRDGSPPVTVEILLDVKKDPDIEHRIPQWPYSIEVKIADGRNWIKGGSLEAVDEHQAVLRAYSKAIDLVSEVLASFVTKAAKVQGAKE